VTRLVAYPVFPNAIHLAWSMGGDIDPGDYSYKVYRSGSPEGPWENLTSIPVPGAPQHTDRDVDLLSKYRELYYFITAHSGRGTVYTSPVKNLSRLLERDDFAKAMEINRMEMVLLRQYAGVEVHILKRRHFGTPCECFDPLTNTVLVKNCQSCAGTRYVGGYFKAIKTYSNISPDRRVRLETQEFTMEPIVSTAWITGYPIVQPNDLFFEADTNRRWIIRDVQNTELRRFPVKQTLVLKELPRSDVEYNIALDYCITQGDLLNEIPDHGRPPELGTLRRPDTEKEITPHLLPKTPTD